MQYIQIGIAMLMTIAVFVFVLVGGIFIALKTGDKLGGITSWLGWVVYLTIAFWAVGAAVLLGVLTFVGILDFGK